MTAPRHKVISMFNRIAPSYDRVNRILSLGIDQVWRKRIKKYIPKEGSLFLLDLATGTADQIIALSHLPHIKSFLGLDLSENMLLLAQKKIEEKKLTQKVDLKLGSALSIPLPSSSIDVITLSFGIRNIEKPPVCLAEMVRCLKPKGVALILEFSSPKWITPLYLFYLTKVLPKVGGFFSKDPHAYTYLSETIQSFPSGDIFLSWMKEAGFSSVKQVRMSFGIVTLYIGEK